VKRRVVVTGIGALTPLGNSAAETWNGLCAGRSGIAKVTKFDTTGFKTAIGGELKGFDPGQFVNAKERRRYDDFIIYALAVSEMAIADSGLRIDGANADRTGVIIGSGIGGLMTIEKAKETILQKGPDSISPFLIPGALGNLAAGQVSIKFGAKGPITCTVTACASGADAVGFAYRIISEGKADAMVAGGSEAAITPLGYAGFNAMRAMSVRNEDPEGASRPFDKGRDGFVMGEGCGILILEELASALNRGARIYAEVAGLGQTSDAFHVAAPPQGHEGAVRCMRLALEDADMAPQDIGYINAHGTSTPLNDLYETQAIKTVFGKHCERLAVSSTKSMTGHMLGGAGGVESVVSVLVIDRQVLPPTINLHDPDPECDLDYVANHSRTADVSAVMNNSFGFGGVNVALIFKRYVS
jgi:3-oxoacyl-[acyl-carrier-protein] synthase II